MSEHLGKIDFLDTPTVNGEQVLLNAGGVPSISSGSSGSIPAAGLPGRLFLDTTTNSWFRDNGTSWDNVSQVPTNVDGTANQITVIDGQPTVVSLANDVVFPGTGGITVPSGTTANRPSTPGNGVIRYSTVNADFEGYQNSEWLPLGEVLQVVNVNIAAATFTSATIPLDNTTPTATEGSQFFSVNFTPLSAASRILVDFPLTVASTTAARTVIVTVFQGSTIIGAATSYAASANLGYPLTFSKSFSTGTTATITISGRCGLSGSGNTVINSTGAATLGGALVSQVRITEVK